MKHTVGIEAMKVVSCLTAGKSGREFFFYNAANRRRSETSPEDIAWNVLNWVSHTGIESLSVWQSSDGTVYDIELWEVGGEATHSGVPEVIYIITSMGGNK